MSEKYVKLDDVKNLITYHWSKHEEMIDHLPTYDVDKNVKGLEKLRLYLGLKNEPSVSVVDTVNAVINMFRDLMFETDNLKRDKRQLGKTIHEKDVKYARKVSELKSQIPKWIPCSERLPQKDGVVMVCFDDGNIGFGEYIDCPETNGYGFNVSYLGNVIAWMSLPPAYESED